MLAMILEARANDNEQCKDQENVGSHGNVGQVFEGAQPTNWDQDKGCDKYVQSFDVTLVIERLKADNLVHLLPNKD